MFAGLKTCCTDFIIDSIHAVVPITPDWKPVIPEVHYFGRIPVTCVTCEQQDGDICHNFRLFEHRNHSADEKRGVSTKHVIYLQKK